MLSRMYGRACLCAFEKLGEHNAKARTRCYNSKRLSLFLLFAREGDVSLQLLAPMAKVHRIGRRLVIMTAGTAYTVFVIAARNDGLMLHKHLKVM
jgi:hypothetical protein